MKRILYLVALFLLFLVAVACSKDEAAPASTEPIEAEETEETEENVENEETYKKMHPLTGLGTNEPINQRTIAVMVNNHPKARPQSGLHKADIVYEVLAEGNVTRFLAIFQSEMPETIGPVRSARDYYVKLSTGFDAFYIAHGYSPDAQQLLETGVVDNINGMIYDGTLFKRAEFRKAPHNSYITFENVMKGAEDNNVATTHDLEPLTFLNEDEVGAIQGDETGDVRVAYSKSDFSIVDYKFDSSVGRYLRYSMDELTEDLDSKEPVYLDNILIVEASHEIIDDAGRNDIDLTSGGNAYLLQKGKKMEVEWKNVNGRIVPYSNSQVVGLVPGKTWINLVPNLDMVSVISAN
ncbi:DUF3048 domain-containing protein [Bacillus sp. DJP31]|uniref:DUF3048 domain-containing protein n=1 Tax=Bacillus sp. DJP31 TaxID=3409789 RepID=UPI003BB7A9C6